MSIAAASAESEDPDSRPLALALASAPADRIWTRAFTDLVIAQALFGFAYAVFLLLPKVLAVAYGASAREIGFVMAAFGVFSLAVIPAIPSIIARLGRRRTMRASFLLLGASGLAFVLVTRAGWPAAFLRGLHGVAWSLFFAAGMSLVAEAVPPGRLGQAIGLYGGASLAMNAVAPAVAEPIAARFGARTVFVLSAAIALVGAGLSRRLRASSVATKRPARNDAPSASSRGLLARVLVVLAVGGLAAAGMFTFVAPFSLAHGVGVVRGFFIAYTAAALAVRIAGARLTDRLGHRRTALAGGVGYGLAVIAMGLCGPRHLLLLGGAFGLAHGIVFPALMALILGSSRPEARPRLLALANGAINVGIVGVGMLGAAAERTGYPAVFVATGAVTFATALLLWQPLSRSSASST